MKKLFFTALVAIVAIGGAYAQQYSTLPNGGGTKFSCDALSGSTCAALFSQGYVYPDGTEPVDLPETSARIIP